MTRQVTVGRIWNIPIRIDATWLIIAGVVLWTLSAVAFPFYFMGYGAGVYWAMGSAATTGLFVSIVIHELAHAAVARRYGTPVEGITLFLLGGVAEMGEEPRTPIAEFLMAGAGPAASFALGLAFIGATQVSIHLAWPETVAGTLGYLAVVNILLALFNLVPAFPLDGGRMLRAVIWRVSRDHGRATRLSVYMGIGLGWTGVAAGALAVLLGNPLAGIWWAMVGLFVRAASKSSWKRMLEDEAEAEAEAEAESGPPVAPTPRPDPAGAMSQPRRYIPAAAARPPRAAFGIPRRIASRVDSRAPFEPPVT